MATSMRIAGSTFTSRASVSQPRRSLAVLRTRLPARIVASAGDKDPLQSVKDKAAELKGSVTGSGYDTASKAGQAGKEVSQRARGALDNGIDPAYSGSAVQVNPLLPSFTRRREVFAGRLAMVGFLSACIGEEMTGRGIIGQVQNYTGWSANAVVLAFAVLIGYNFIGALSPSSPTFSNENQKDVAKRPDGPLQGNPAEAISVTGFGFTKSNELFTGRTAMIGFASALIGEVLTHQGPLAQVAGYLHTPADAAFYETAKFGFVLSVVAILGLATLFGNLGQAQDGDKDIY